MRNFLFASAASLLLATTGHAQPVVTVTLTPEGEAIAAASGKTADQYATELEGEVAKLYGLVDVAASMRAFANATSMSQRGLGIDYASNADAIVFGIGGGVAVGGDPLSDTPSGGGALNLAIMAGVPFAGKWTLWGNGFRRSATTDRVSGSITSGGLHLSRKFGTPTKGAMGLALGWGGVDVNAGVEYTRWAMSANDSLSSDFPSGNLTITANSTGQLDVSASSLVVPVEVTTSVRFLYLLSLYAGVGVDATKGESSVVVDLASQLTAPGPGGTTTDVGSATVTGAADGAPTQLSARGLVGLQANIWKLRIFAQAQLATSKTGQVAFGLRVAI